MGSNLSIVEVFAHNPCFLFPSRSIRALYFSTDRASTIQTLANFSPLINPLINRLRICESE